VEVNTLKAHHFLNKLFTAQPSGGFIQFSIEYSK